MGFLYHIISISSDDNEQSHILQIKTMQQTQAPSLATDTFDVGDKI